MCVCLNRRLALKLRRKNSKREFYTRRDTAAVNAETDRDVGTERQQSKKTDK